MATLLGRRIAWRRSICKGERDGSSSSFREVRKWKPIVQTLKSTNKDTLNTNLCTNAVSKDEEQQQQDEEHEIFYHGEDHDNLGTHLRWYLEIVHGAYDVEDEAQDVE